VLLKQGPGARAVVAGYRAAPNPGHVFNAMNVEGRVYFVDGQTGGAAVVSDPTYTNWAMLQTSPRKP
jgi:lipoate-protein ligase A